MNERWVMSRNVSEKHLKEIFGHFGEVKDVSIQYLPHSSISSGTAYIVMASEEDVEKAIKGMHKGQIDGTPSCSPPH